MQIAVVGAGIVGLTTAYTLQKAGHEVMVFEGEDQVALGASWGNAGLVSAASAEAWANPAMVRAGIGWLFKADAPLKIHLGWDWERLNWLARFAWQAKNYEANTRALAQLALAARTPLREMARDADVAFDLTARGVLDLYGSEAERAHAKRLSGWLAQEGVQQEFLTPHELRQMEPSVQKDFAFGVYTPDDLTACSQKLCEGLATQLTIETNTPVRIIEPKADKVEVNARTFDRLIICAAYGSKALAKQLGDHLPLYPVKGYSLTLDVPTDTVKPTRGLLDHDGKVAVSPLGNRLRVGGTAEIGAMDRSLPPTRLSTLQTWVQDALPHLADLPAHGWAGFRPMSSGVLPIVRPCKRHRQVIYNTGHGHLGWTIAAASAVQVMKLV